MSVDTEPTPDVSPLAVNSLRALHLLPSAPHELITEVYWRLVGELRIEAASDPTATAKLNDINQAYAWSVGRAEHPDLDGGFRGSEASHAQHSGRLRRRAKEASRPTPVTDPWQLLHLCADAPPSVVDLAYDYWKLRLRSRWGESSDALSTLQEAYHELRTGEVHPGEPQGVPDAAADDGPPIPHEFAEVSDSAENDVQAAAVELAQPARRRPRTALRRRAGAVVRAGVRGAGGAVRAFGRWTGRTSKKEGHRLVIVFGRWAADPFGERRSGPKPKKRRTPEPADELASSTIEGRFAELAAARSRSTAGAASEAAVRPQADQTRIADDPAVATAEPSTSA